jgi:hypothetical protein
MAEKKGAVSIITETIILNSRQTKVSARSSIDTPELLGKMSGEISGRPITVILVKNQNQYTPYFSTTPEAGAVILALEQSNHAQKHDKKIEAQLHVTRGTKLIYGLSYPYVRQEGEQVFHIGTSENTLLGKEEEILSMTKTVLQKTPENPLETKVTWYSRSGDFVQKNYNKSLHNFTGGSSSSARR